jgi:UDP-N-acetylmuramate--alanine ligase
VPFWGAAVLCLDHPGVQAIVPRMSRRTLTYGTASQADLVATDISVDGLGMRFGVRHRGALLGAARVRLTGQHNVRNSLAALSVALEVGVPFAEAAEALDSFGGIERRFQIKGEAAGVRVVDDYGHHPAEVRATLAAARARTRAASSWPSSRTAARARATCDDFARLQRRHRADRLRSRRRRGQDPGRRASLVEALRRARPSRRRARGRPDQVRRGWRRVRPGDRLTLSAAPCRRSDRLLARPARSPVIAPEARAACALGLHPLDADGAPHLPAGRRPAAGVAALVIARSPRCRWARAARWACCT